LLFTIEVLTRLFSGKITPDNARIELLFYYTGYRPNRKITVPEEREIIHFNLLRLSEQVTFAFTVEENTIVPHFSFKHNPLPALKMDGIEYPGKKFNLDITAKTDITAKELVYAFDLLAAFQKLEEDAKEECLNQLCAILHPAEPTHKQNLVSCQIENMRKVDALKKTLILFWFIGIVNFYTNHPVYSLLFSGRKKTDDDDEKIYLGLNEVSLHLRKEGYGDPDTMNLNDYFDAQVKSLKDTINKALGVGAKIEEIAQKTGIPFSTIIKLK
jgi:hypothetical protein